MATSSPSLAPMTVIDEPFQPVPAHARQALRDDHSPQGVEQVGMAGVGFHDFAPRTTTGW